MLHSWPPLAASSKSRTGAFMLAVSFIHVLFIGMTDALIKGSVIAHCHNWAKVPWYFKDENLLYPTFIATILFSLGFFLARRFAFGWKYLLMLFVWAVGGLESLSYWFWIAVLPIGQEMWWLPDSSFFWWYPPHAPWLNKLLHLQWLSRSQSVSRHGVLIGAALAIAVNMGLAFSRKEKSNAEGSGRG